MLAGGGARGGAAAAAAAAPSARGDGEADALAVVGRWIRHSCSTFLLLQPRVTEVFE